jgi:homeodomain-containing protein
MALHDPPPPVRCRHVCPLGGDVAHAAGGGELVLTQRAALYQERRVKPRRPDSATRVIFVLSRLLDWRSLLTVVQPDTLIRWHRQGWRLLWRWKSRSGRPPIPVDLQRLIVTMAQANPTWGEEQIANELLLKLGLTVSPRTVGRYIRRLRPRRDGRRSQRWAAFVRSHAHAVVACDFFTTVTGPLPCPLCVRRPGGRHASDPPLERDRASHGGVDDPAVPHGYHSGDVPPVRSPRSGWL